MQAQSDWGIDTRFTIATTAAGFGTAETYVPQGKIHKLYGSLTDIKDMAIECFAALQSARKIAVGSETLHDMEPVDLVSEAVNGRRRIRSVTQWVFYAMAGPIASSSSSTSSSLRLAGA